jgi:hypothetical protein
VQYLLRRDRRRALALPLTFDDPAGTPRSQSVADSKSDLDPESSQESDSQSLSGKQGERRGNERNGTVLI